MTATSRVLALLLALFTVALGCGDDGQSCFSDLSDTDFAADSSFDLAADSSSDIAADTRLDLVADSSSDSATDDSPDLAGDVDSNDSEQDAEKLVRSVSPAGDERFRPACLLKPTLKKGFAPGSALTQRLPDDFDCVYAQKRSGLRWVCVPDPLHRS